MRSRIVDYAFEVVSNNYPRKILVKIKDGIFCINSYLKVENYIDMKEILLACIDNRVYSGFESSPNHNFSAFQ